MIKVFFLSLPVYFFAVFFNTLAGFILCSEYIKEKIPALAGLAEFVENKKIKFAAGVGSLVAGICKLIWPVGIIIVGDIIPALVCIGLGFALLTDFFKENTAINEDTINRVDGLVAKNKKMIGGLGLVASAIHLLFAASPIFL